MYIDYKIALSALQRLLGLGNVVDYEVRPELSPYLNGIISYLVRRLTTVSEEDSNIKTLVQEVYDIFDWGADLIIANDATSLAIEVGVMSEDYNNDHFIFTWANVLSCLKTRLKIMYDYLFEDGDTSGCSCPCAKGETWKDWESKVYPEDEEYDDSGITALGNGGSTITWPQGNGPKCGCSGR